ncbi:MAG: TatD family hydrolase [Oscillospiraceae bacterium]|jgi:TatD DNase family protein|nr:TatD family hydrolase [Oscillospiraceae bacterium]
MEKIKLFDTHTHYDDRAYKGGADAVIEKALADNVAGFMAIGCTLDRSRKAVKIAESRETAYAAVGIHPNDVGGLPPDYLERLEETAKSEKVKAIGEIGLDYHYKGYDRENQIKAFKEQLRLAERLGLPVIIHSREAAEDTMEILREFKPRAVTHCYSGSAETAGELVKMGILISFTGALTFKNARRAVEACAAVPLEKLMIETDCPYMAPEPFRGELCASGMAWFTAAKIAEIKGLSTKETVKVCNENAKRFFGIDF